MTQRIKVAQRDGRQAVGVSSDVRFFRGETGPQGPKGDTGAAGRDGISATHSWSGTTLTVTSASGTSSADLKGDRGEKGDPGIHFGSEAPSGSQDVWIDPSGEPSSTEVWQFVLVDGGTVSKTVVVVG